MRKNARRVWPGFTPNASGRAGTSSSSHQPRGRPSIEIPARRHAPIACWRATRLTLLLCSERGLCPGPRRVREPRWDHFSCRQHVPCVWRAAGRTGCEPVATTRDEEAWRGPPVAWQRDGQRCLVRSGAPSGSQAPGLARRSPPGRFVPLWVSGFCCARPEISALSCSVCVCVCPCGFRSSRFCRALVGRRRGSS